MPSEAPAATLHHFASLARQDVGQDPGKDMCRNNASRDAHRFVAKWGLTWRVPFSFIKHEVDGDPNDRIAYISPKSFITFLAEKAPELSTIHGVWLSIHQNQLSSTAAHHG